MAARQHRIAYHASLPKEPTTRSMKATLVLDHALEVFCHSVICRGIERNDLQQSLPSFHVHMCAAHLQ
jgi:hypothetical protein